MTFMAGFGIGMIVGIVVCYLVVVTLFSEEVEPDLWDQYFEDLERRNEDE